MKYFLVIIAVLFIASTVFAGDVYVKGHWRDTNGDGIKDTYVQPYHRTSPDSYRTNNYDYPGNYNPNTGYSTPQSNSPRELYPTNPNPYGNRQHRSW